MWQNKQVSKWLLVLAIFIFLTPLALFSAKAQPPIKEIKLPDLTQLADVLKPSVAKVEVTKENEEELPEDHPPIPPDKRKGIGSAFVIDSSGLLLTNNHVVQGAKKVEVVLNKQRYAAKTVGADAKTDVALIKIASGEKIPALKLGNSDKLKTGSWVVAIGNPFGMENNLTLGIISGKERQVPEAPDINFLQTDAEIYPGNSGGPLVNLKGEVVGINTAIDENAQLSLAIPINKAKEVLPRLKGD